MLPTMQQGAPGGGARARRAKETPSQSSQGLPAAEDAVVGRACLEFELFPGRCGAVPRC